MVGPVMLLFLAQFAMVNLLALQSRFVRDSQYAAAFMNSVCLGLCGLYITPILADGERLKQSPTLLSAYLIAGPLAVCLAIWSHDRHFQRVRRKSASAPTNANKGDAMLIITYPAPGEFHTPETLGNRLARFTPAELRQLLQISETERALALAIVDGFAAHGLRWIDEFQWSQVFTNGELERGAAAVVPEWFLAKYRTRFVEGEFLSTRFLRTIVERGGTLEPERRPAKCCQGGTCKRATNV